MGGVISTVLRVASIAVQFIPGIGQLAKIGITIGLALLDKALAPKNPKVPPSQRDRLFASIDPSAPRKIVFGSTAMATDVRYEEYGGADQEYLDRIICVASHKVAAIREIWIEDKLAWSASGGVTSTYSGYLTIATRLEGSAANTIAINGGAKWGSTRRLTGCAYVHMRFKLTGNSKKAQSPFASGVPQRLTIIGDGALLYDPRQDSSVGGSGSQRADDQSTWTWVSDVLNENAALVILLYLLGWRINGKLAVGKGIPPRRIDMASFIAAANLCEESVALAAGGSEARYRCAGVVSEADAPSSVLDAMLATCAGTLRDSSGQLALHILHNDLGSPVAFTDDDILDEFQWTPTLGLDESFNVVRGRYTDPSTNSLYQLVDYPAVRLNSPDGLERHHSFDLAMVESGTQAQRLAKQELQRAQWQGVLSASFKATAWRVQVGRVIALTFSPLGFAGKLFRVTEQVISMDGRCAMVLREENAAIYAWSMSEAATVVAAAPTVYDPLNSPLIQAVSELNDITDTQISTLDALALTVEGKSAIWTTASAPSHLVSSENDYWQPNGTGLWYRRVAGTGRLAIGSSTITLGGNYLTLCWTPADDPRIPAAITAAAGAQATADGKVASFNQEATPVAEGVGDLWYQPSTKIVKRWSGSAWELHSSLGAPAGTEVAGRAAEDVTAASVNFDARNDRLVTAVVAPTIAGDGSAVDHTLNANGSADLSFEWVWGGTEADIDGFEIMVRGSTASGSFTPDASASGETVYIAQPNKRAFILYGVQPTLYWTFAVRAFRVVDPDVSASGFLRSAWVQPGASGENPYRPETNTAFAGDVSGTVNGVAAAVVSNYTRNVDRGAWSASSVAYVIGDEVQNQSSTWGALTNHTSTAGNGPPTLPTTANATWRLRAKAGDAGAPGYSTVQVQIYKRSATTPALPTATTTYTFATGALTGLDNGWTQAVPASDGNPLYTSVAIASSQGATDTIAPGEWASPVIQVQDGSAGAKAAPVFIYQRTATASAPALPTATATFTFATGGITGLDNGWTADLPASGGAYRWRAVAAALSTGATDTIGAGEWAAPQLIAQDGDPGATGASTITVFQRSLTAPSTPADSSGTPSGWYASTTSVPAGSNAIWASVGQRAAGGANYVFGTPYRAEAISTSQTGQSVALPASASVSSTLSFALGAGVSRVIYGQATFASPTGSGTAHVQIEYRESGLGWTASNGPSVTYAVGEPASAFELNHSITVTNTGVASAVFEVRGSAVRSNANSGAVTAAESFLTI